MDRDLRAWLTVLGVAAISGGRVALLVVPAGALLVLRTPSREPRSGHNMR